MGSWGDSTERRADRMPKLRFQIHESQNQAQAVDQNAAVRDAMMVVHLCPSSQASRLIDWHS